MTATVTDWVVGTSHASFPGPVVEAAKRGIVDTLGVMLAGSREDVTRLVARTVAEDGARPVARQVGSDLRTSAQGAALVNGTSGHALDFDDIHEETQGHPSTVILPAALAVGEMVGADGPRLIEAYVIGLEVMAKIGAAIGPRAYAKGWHATSMLGPLGSAAAAGKLLGLGADAMERALAMAVSFAGGSRQNFGTMTKPVHAGWAASAGVTAARLAAAGVSASAGILEAPLGLFALFEGDPDAGLGELGRPYSIVTPGLTVKVHPCCGSTHRSIDAALAVRAASPRGVDEIAAVDVFVPPGETVALIYERPATGLEGKFCLPYTVARALLDGALTIDTFEDGRTREPEAVALMDKVRVTEREAADGHGAEVRVTYRDGSSVSRAALYPRGAPEAPLGRDEIHAKFLVCAKQVVGPRQGEAAVDALWRLESVGGIASVLDLLTPA
jgi:2-methylcitrate dehydratase PrpD